MIHQPSKYRSQHNFLVCSAPLIPHFYLFFLSSLPPTRVRLAHPVHPPMHSVSDLTTFSRKTSGDVPPKLVVRIFPADARITPSIFISALQGASTTVVGDKVYLYVGPPFDLLPTSFHLTPHPHPRAAVLSQNVEWSQTCTSLISRPWFGKRSLLPRTIAPLPSAISTAPILVSTTFPRGYPI